MNPLLIVHIIGAAIALFAGVFAVSSAKGGWLHRRSGLVFVGAMLTMCASAVVLAVSRVQPLNVIAGLLTGYLVLTALLTVRRASPVRRRLDIGLMVLALTVGLGAIGAGTRSDEFRSAFFLFGVLGVLGSVGDFKTLRAGVLLRAPRLTRHLWRMCLAFWIATASFFFGSRGRVEAVLPDVMATMPYRAMPVVAVLVVLFYSLWRVRRARAQSPPAPLALVR